MTYNARELASAPKGHEYDDLPNKFDVAFEDNVVVASTKKQLIYSNYFWELHRRYPKTPLLSRHHVKHVLKEGILTTSTHIELLTIIVKDIAKHYQMVKPIEIEDLAMMVYRITNFLYNEITEKAEAHVTSIDILDFIEIVDNEKVKIIVDNTEPTEKSINDCYVGVKKLLLEDPCFADNSVAKYLRSGTASINQVLQAVAVRGFLTDIAGDHYLTPVMSNFTKGLHNLHDYMVETMAAAKSLYYSQSVISDSEYFARRLQLLCMTVEAIEYEDCGSTKYVNWRVNPPVKDPSKGINYPGDLKFMLGKTYLDEETGKLKQIEFDDPSLYNKVLKMRSVIYCKAKNPHHVCHVCFGGLSANVSRFANIGHLCASTLTNQLTSSLLATKHLMSSSVAVTIILGDTALKLFDTSKNKKLILLRKEFKERGVKLIVSREQLPGLTDIFVIDKIENINPTRIGSIKDVNVSYKTREGEINLPIVLAQANRNPILTKQFLEHLKAYSWTVDNRNNFIFDMTEWDFSQPLFRLPETEYSYADHTKNIARLIESSIEEIADRVSPESPSSTLQELFTLVNSKLNVNIAALEIIIYANMVSGPDKHDLARNAEEPVLGISKQLIKSRSMGASLAYEDIARTITNPSSFFKLDRPDSPFDVCVCPKEVLEHKKSKTS